MSLVKSAAPARSDPRWTFPRALGALLLLVCWAEATLALMRLTRSAEGGSRLVHAAGLFLALRAAHQGGLDFGMATTGLDPGAAALAGVAASGAYEVAKSLVTDWCKTWAKTPPEDPGKLFANGHLTQLIGEAIHGVLVRERAASVGQFKTQLDELLPHVVAHWKEHWPALTAGPLAEAHAGELTAVLHHQIQEVKHHRMATPAAWEEFLRGLAQAQKIELEEAPRRSAAERLHQELAHAIYEKATQAAKNNPRAWAALQLQFQSWVLKGVAEL